MVISNYELTEKISEAPQVRSQRASMRILVADDQAANRKLLRAQLEAEALEITEAADGMEALEILAREPIDVVISDILMPRMGGYRFGRELRRHPKFCLTPFIRYTSPYTSVCRHRVLERAAVGRALHS